ncbi:MAG: thiolase family protein [Chloroflexi bacterium]|nr:thiolase family protein [Chloroflexota bacterium]
MRGREVYVVGVGMHQFGRFPDLDFTDLGRVAVLNALKDAGLSWRQAEAAFCGTAYGDVGAGHRIAREIALTGIPIVNVENACSSGGSAFRLACQSIAGGMYDIAIAYGLEKIPKGMIASTADPEWQRIMGMSVRPADYAMVARRHMDLHGTTAIQLAKVSVKNHRNGCKNPYAHYQQECTVEEVLASRMIADPLTLFMCCPTSEGAAAAVLCCRDKMPEGARPVRIAASVLKSAIYLGPEPLHGDNGRLTAAAAREAYDEAAIGPEDLDLIETHDAMAIAEVTNCEHLGLCAPGEGGRLVDEGALEIGGRIPVNPSGGLLARGHALGATGLAQITEIVLQLRGEASARQIAGARVGLAHTLGAGPNCAITILKR